MIRNNSYIVFWLSSSTSWSTAFSFNRCLFSYNNCISFAHNNCKLFFSCLQNFEFINCSATAKSTKSTAANASATATKPTHSNSLSSWKCKARPTTQCNWGNCQQASLSGISITSTKPYRLFCVFSHDARHGKCCQNETSDPGVPSCRWSNWSWRTHSHHHDK